MAPATPEENYKMFFAVIECSGNAKIDWEAVGKITGMKKGSIQMRYTRLKKSMDAGGGFGADRPATGSGGRKRKAANEQNAGPQKRKTKANGSPFEGEDEEIIAAEDGGAGGEQEEV